MTTLAAHLDAANTHMERVRAEYEHTKADHALPEGCTTCTRGFVEGRSIGWDYDPDGTPALCPECAYERTRYAKQLAAAPPTREWCRNGHEMVPANIYQEAQRPHLDMCIECRRDRCRRADARRAAARAAARAAR